MPLEVSQKENALTSIAPFAQGSLGVAKMSYNIAEGKFPALSLTEEDFFPRQDPTQGQPPIQPEQPLQALTQ